MLSEGKVTDFFYFAEDFCRFNAILLSIFYKNYFCFHAAKLQPLFFLGGRII